MKKVYLLSFAVLFCLLPLLYSGISIIMSGDRTMEAYQEMSAPVGELTPPTVEPTPYPRVYREPSSETFPVTSSRTIEETATVGTPLSALTLEAIIGAIGSLNTILMGWYVLLKRTGKEEEAIKS